MFIPMKRIFLLVFILMVFLAGCSLQKTAKPDNSWKSEVLQAQECGMDGLPCCQSKDQPCLYNQECCIDPNNAKNTYCSDSCSLGKEKTFCRVTDPKCDPGFTCVDSRCELCGGENEACCTENDICKSDLLCSNNKCVKCGLPGNPCCAKGLACNDEKSRDKTRTECYNGGCVYCGGNGGIACRNEPLCSQGNLLNNDFCLPCGSYNQPCCNEAAATGYVCDPKQELNCILGFCSKIK
jgi:hypothetical protein